jgi:hypothetical protein
MVMGLIGGLNRGPKFPPRARRANARLALTDADQITVNGAIAIPVVTSDETDSTDLNSSPAEGEIVLLIGGGGSTIKLCVAYGGNWYSETLTQMG